VLSSLHAERKKSGDTSEFGLLIPSGEILLEEVGVTNLLLNVVKIGQDNLPTANLSQW
jgi:hypothetical protein